MDEMNFANKEFVQGGVMIAVGCLWLCYLLDKAQYGLFIFLLLVSTLIIIWGLHMIGVIGFFKRLFKRS